MFPSIHAWAFAGFNFPGGFAFKILRPERPGPALQRANLIDPADALGLHDHLALARTSRRFDLLQENAFVFASTGARFVQAPFAVDFSAMPVDGFLHGELQMRRQPANFLFGNPHIPRPAGAAIPAAGAGEVQALLLPGGF